MKLRILFILILSTQLIYAQSDRQYISLAVGPSFPLNDFAKMDLNDSTSGWAKTGVAFEFTYAYRLTHNFGLQGKISYSSNKFDNFSYEDALAAIYSRNPEDADTSFSSESSKNWSSAGFLVGPYIRFPFSSSLSWDIKALVGMFGVSSPELVLNGSTNSGDILQEYYRLNGRGYAFAYNLGTGFKYKVSNYYALLFVDYFESKVKINNVAGWDWNDEPYNQSIKQDVSYLSVTLGLGYYF
ncbi:MAG: outer membrane beta-barrel protein [Bacteroidetes bacterium]|nr:outer membrane beta-barrel protein [Bacteroidota bacterium]